MSVAMARLGLGLIQAPRYGFEADFASGALVAVLAAFPPARSLISVLYPPGRQLSPRVRVFVDRLVRIFADHVSQRDVAVPTDGPGEHR